eukprot:GHVS01025226.1.p2 GENE.GHVS01025226.1~~GHVS01025226.1.p2  ORF type:complete len:170 (-),score=42.78 GHVS01025226.1:382-891(-)
MDESAQIIMPEGGEGVVVAEGDGVVLGEQQEEGGKLWYTVSVVLALVALLWIADKLYSAFLRYAAARRNRMIEQEKKQMQTARDRQVQRLEEEAEKFKGTEEYKEQLEQSKRSEHGIQSHHHTHTVSRATDRSLEGSTTNPYFDRSLSGRSNKPSGDGMRRRPGDGGGG